MADFEERSGVVACETEWGRWYQTVEDVSLEINLTPGTKGREVKVDISTRRIQCQIRGTVIIKGKLFDSVIEDESTWTIEDQKLLRVLLVKSRKSDYWSSLLENGQYQPNPAQLLQMRHKLDLERFQLEHPGLDFSQANLDKQYPDMMEPYLQTQSSDQQLLGATAMPVSHVSNGENKTDDEKLLESQHQNAATRLLGEQSQSQSTEQHNISPPSQLDNLLESVDRLSVVTDDMKQENGGGSSGDSAVTIPGGGGASGVLLDPRVTDDMKTEPAMVVEPVVTDDMKTEENESLETDEEKSGL
eukprot:TRINITY_DN9188_c0_g1_i11.p1 TRINITY_DN9188_c0_g1~~TRINITY_DN9188_c0_g1_i11.p1  ORF type:complete len:302 (-),score=43.87 TRINITY_DN9188_c0_g1_i11:1106-2011(-)